MGHWDSLIKKNKPRLSAAQRQDYDGYTFMSKLERDVYMHLKLLQKAGEIKSIQPQKKIYLTESRIGYIADFECVDKNGEIFYVEAKGFETEIWLLKKKLYKYYGPARLDIYKQGRGNVYLSEQILPKGLQNEKESKS